MTAPLFEPEPTPEPVQVCQGCSRSVQASDDRLRVRGWTVFDGRSVTDKPLHVRRCPTCREKGIQQ